MFRSRVFVVVLVVMISAILAAPAAWGVPRQASSDRLSSDPIARLWHSLTSLWLGIGCVIDPHSGCLPGVTSPPVGAGCGLDPHGACQASSSAPPVPQPTTDAGCVADPHGG